MSETHAKSVRVEVSAIWFVIGSPSHYFNPSFPHGKKRFLLVSLSHPVVAAYT